MVNKWSINALAYAYEITNECKIKTDCKFSGSISYKKNNDNNNDKI